jgi:rod shape-determining protein MreD
MRRFLTLFACSIVLWVIVTQLNHSLSGAHIYLFTAGLFVTFAALTQPFAGGLWVALCAGLVFDANTPVAFGTHLVLFAITHILVFRLRDRVPRNDTASRVIVAVLANLALFIVFSVLQIIRLPTIAANWPRMLLDLVCSQLFIVLVAPWFFALQARALALVGLERETFA